MPKQTLILDAINREWSLPSTKKYQTLKVFVLINIVVLFAEWCTGVTGRRSLKRWIVAVSGRHGWMAQTLVSCLHLKLCSGPMASVWTSSRVFCTGWMRTTTASRWCFSTLQSAGWGNTQAFMTLFRTKNTYTLDWKKQGNLFIIFFLNVSTWQGCLKG